MFQLNVLSDIMSALSAMFFTYSGRGVKSLNLWILTSNNSAVNQGKVDQLINIYVSALAQITS